MLSSGRISSGLLRRFWASRLGRALLDAGRWLLPGADQLANFDRFLEMVESVGFYPPLGSFHEEVGVVVAVGKERVEREANAFSLFGDFVVAHGNGFRS